MAGLLQDYVTHQAERNPERIALVFKTERIVYSQLEERSNQLARMLQEMGCERGDRICLLAPKSPAAILGILGIYKADCIYVPLDPSSPPARLLKIIQSCESRWVLAAASVGPLLEEIGRENGVSPLAVGWIGSGSAERERFRPAFTLDDLSQLSGAPLDYRSARHDPAHILFTSGSTGVPKGVVITHANVHAFVEWAKDYFGLNASDRVSCHSPLHFDLSVFDIFGAFAAGAELHLVPQEINILPNKLADFIRSSKLTQWFSVPSVLSHMAKFDVVGFHDFPELRRLLWCGEVFPTPALIYWMKRLPHVSFTNLYGPTEATIASSYYTVPRCPVDEKPAVPIGSACPGEELLVLDENLQPLPPGEAGDLYIRGVGLSPGYWRDPEKTRAAFHPDPENPARRIYKTGDLARIGADGLVYFVGRSDSQIKSRGYRIELGEIEAALHTLDSLRECAVVAIPTNGFEGSRICCAYVPVPGRDVTPTSLRKELSKLLPGYMLPSSWIALGRLPKNCNGKIDRGQLREEFQRHEACTP